MYINFTWKPCHVPNGMKKCQVHLSEWKKPLWWFHYFQTVIPVLITEMPSTDLLQKTVPQQISLNTAYTCLSSICPLLRKNITTIQRFPVIRWQISQLKPTLLWPWNGVMVTEWYANFQQAHHSTSPILNAHNHFLHASINIPAII